VSRTLDLKDDEGAVLLLTAVELRTLLAAGHAVMAAWHEVATSGRERGRLDTDYYGLLRAVVRKLEAVFAEADAADAGGQP
jgi:hypothetical protein